MLSSLRWRLAAALLLVMLLGAGAMASLAALQSQAPAELIEETSLSSQARETLRGVGREGRVVAQGGWNAAYHQRDGAYFTLYDASGRERARSPNLLTPLPDLPVPPGAEHSRLTLTGPDQVLTQSVRVPGGGHLVVGRVNPEARGEPVSDRLLDRAPLLTLVVILLFAAGLVAAVASWSLRPLRRAAEEAAVIGPLRPDARLSEAGMLSEALPLARAVNRALDRVAEAYEAEKRFTADSAHALRTPLTVLDLRLQRMEAGMPVPTEHLRADVAELIRIVTGLLKLAQGDRLRSRYLAETTNLARALREAAAEIAPRLEAAGRDLAVSAPQEAHVRGAPGEWRDALTALLDNAVAHGEGRVEVALSTRGPNEVLLFVSDRGAGVPGEFRDRVFERFHKVDGSTPGAGLGLAIVQQCARRAGGMATFREAATVELRLPTAAPAGSA